MDQRPQGKKSNMPLIVALIAIIVIGAGVGIYFATKGTKSNTNVVTPSTANTSAGSNTASDPYAAFRQYDGKVITISSTDGKIAGRIAIALRPSEDMPIQVVYFLKVIDNLPKKSTSFSGASYHYIASHAAAADIRNGAGTGVLSAAFCNKDQMPDVLALAQQGSANVTTYNGCDEEYAVGATTNTFYHIYADYYDASTFNYSALTSRDTFAVFDTSPYYESDAGTGGYTVNTTKVIQQGTIAASYHLVYTE